MIEVKHPSYGNQCLAGIAGYSKSIAALIIKESCKTDDEKRFYELVKELAEVSERLNLKDRR